MLESAKQFVVEVKPELKCTQNQIAQKKEKKYINLKSTVYEVATFLVYMHASVIAADCSSRPSCSSNRDWIVLSHFLVEGHLSHVGRISLQHTDKAE